MWGGVQVTQMFDKAEADARDLQERKRTVEADKHKIYTVSPAPTLVSRLLCMHCLSHSPCAGHHFLMLPLRP